MRVLAVDTTSAHGSVALVRDELLEGVLGIALPRPRHAERLLPAIDQLLRDLGLGLSALDGLAVAVGPGSFTGLRIGIAAIEGLAYATGLPAVGVSSLEASVYRYRHRGGMLLAMLEAYRDEVYAQAFYSDGSSIRRATDPVCVPPDALFEDLPEAPVLVAGTATPRYREVLSARAPGAIVAEASFFVAEEVARLGGARLARGERAPLGGLGALYVRPSEAERNRARRERGSEVRSS